VGKKKMTYEKDDGFLDCIGVPEYFTTHLGSVEDVGNGLIRMVRCIQRNGVLIPVFSVVLPFASLVDVQRIREKVRKIVVMEESASRH
jgi:hypothetical protein